MRRPVASTGESESLCSGWTVFALITLGRVPGATLDSSSWIVLTSSFNSAASRSLLLGTVTARSGSSRRRDPLQDMTFRLGARSSNVSNRMSSCRVVRSSPAFWSRRWNSATSTTAVLAEIYSAMKRNCYLPPSFSSKITLRSASRFVTSVLPAPAFGIVLRKRSSISRAGCT